MKRRLRLRLTITHAAVAALAVIVAAVIVSATGGSRFDGYLTQVQQAREAVLVNTLTATYRAPVGWDATAVFAVSRIAVVDAVDVAVYSPSGDLLFTAQGLHAGPASASRAATLQAGQLVVSHYALRVGGKTVGSVDAYAARDLRGTAESAYQSSLLRNLTIAGLVAVVAALLVSLLVSRRLTGPLEELADAAEDVAAGNLDVRVAPRADDEVGALAVAFDAMADRLARDEQWRRDMTSDLSDELRRPLAIIQERLESLEDGAPPTTPEALRAIGAEVEQLGHLLGALHSLNELESEDLSVEYQGLDLSDVARAACDGVAQAFGAKGVALSDDLQTVMVKADRERLLQAIADLLDNALKFTPRGGRVVLAVAAAKVPRGGAAARATATQASVGAGPQAAAAAGTFHGRTARLTVTDSGPGIDPVDLPFVFDRFYRSHAARGTQGIGLGLAVARGLIEAQGGTIEAANGPRGGAVFTVELPAAP